MFVRIEAGQIAAYPYSPAQLRADNPGTSFPDTMPDALLAEWGVYPVQPTPQPEYDPATQRISEGQPVRQQVRNTDGTFRADDPQTPENEAWQWVQTWVVSDLTPEEIAAALAEWRTSMSVTPLQIRRALLARGLLDDVTAFVDASSLDVRMAWEYAVQIDRDNALIAAAAEALGVTDAQVDDLFRLAATL